MGQFDLRYPIAEIQDNSTTLAPPAPPLLSLGGDSTFATESPLLIQEGCPEATHHMVHGEGAGWLSPRSN